MPNWNSHKVSVFAPRRLKLQAPEGNPDLNGDMLIYCGTNGCFSNDRACYASVKTEHEPGVVFTVCGRCWKLYIQEDGSEARLLRVEDIWAFADRNKRLTYLYVYNSLTEIIKKFYEENGIVYG